MNDLLKNILLWVVMAVILMSVFNNLSSQRSAANTLSYTDFITRVKSGDVQNVGIDGREIEGRLIGGETFTTFSPETDNKALIGDLLDGNVQIRAVPTEKTSVLTQIFISWFPFLLLIGVWIFFMRQMQGGAGGRGAMSFGKSKARLMGEDQVKINFLKIIYKNYGN